MDSNTNEYLNQTANRRMLLEKAQFGDCKICHDKASGIHYGVITCEGCKVINFIFLVKFGHYPLYSLLILGIGNFLLFS
jgi:hypothetical protein